MTQKIVLWMLVLILVMSVPVSADILTNIYNNSFLVDDDWTDSRGECAGGTTVDGFTGLQILLTAPGECYKNITDTSSGIVLAHWDMYFRVIDIGGGGTLLGFDNSDVPTLDGAMAIQSADTSQDLMRWAIEGDTNPTIAGHATENRTISIRLVTDFDGDTVDVYYNDTQVIASTSFTSDSYKSFGYDEGGTGHITDYLIKDLFICTVSTTSDTTCIEAPPPPVSNLTLFDEQPQNNTQFNSTAVLFNVTINSTQISNVSIILDGILNQSVTNISAGNNIVINFTINFGASGNHTFWFNGTDSIGNTNTSDDIRDFFIDLVIPAITTNFVNGTFFFNESVTADFNFTDDFQLSSFNITVDGIQIAGNDTLETDTFNFTLDWNTENLTAGVHELQVRVADGHTATSIPQYTWTNGLFNNYLRYRTPQGADIWIRAKDQSIFDTWDTQKEKDRYTFEFSPSKTISKGMYEFVVLSNQPMRVMRDKERYGTEWLIVGEHWVDFFQNEAPGNQVSIYLSDPYTAQIKVKPPKLSDTSLFFSSIGDLNIITQNFTFFKINVTATFVSPVLELSTVTHTLFVNAGVEVTNISAFFTYNNTLFNTTKTNTSTNATFVGTVTTPQVNETTNISVLWDINVTLLNGSISVGNLTYFQQVLPFGIDNCTTFTVQAINFTILNETDDAVVPNANLAGNFEVQVDEVNAIQIFNLSWQTTAESNYAVCIDPNGASFLFDADMEYSATGFTTKTHYFDNSTLDNATDFINLFLTEDTSLVEFTVVDENNNPLSGVFINIQRCDITTASCSTSEIIKTDGGGNAIGSIILNTVFYKFTLTRDNEVLLETTESKLTATQKTFIVTLVTDVITNFNTVINTVCTITFNNVTNDFNLVFTDTTGNVNRACLRVVRRTMNGDTEVNSTCVTSSSGSLFTNTGNVTGSTSAFIGIGTVSINGDEFLCGDSVTHNFDRTFEIFGTAGGLFMAFFLIVALASTFIFNPMYAVLGTALAMSFIGALQLWYMTWGILIGWFIIAGIVMWRINRGS